MAEGVRDSDIELQNKGLVACAEDISDFIVFRFLIRENLWSIIHWNFY